MLTMGIEITRAGELMAGIQLQKGKRDRGKDLPPGGIVTTWFSVGRHENGSIPRFQ